VFFAWQYARPRGLIVSLGVMQAALNVLLWSRPKLLWEDGDGQSKLLSLAGPAVDLNAWFPSVPPSPSPSSLIVVPALLALVALTALVCVITLSVRPRTAT
jgi:hypothetical protein